MISTVNSSPLNFGLNSHKNLTANRSFSGTGISQDQDVVKVPVETHKAYALVSFEGKPKVTFPEALADSAREIAETMNTQGSCKKAVRLALEKHGILIKGVSAYMSADQLAKNSLFNEIDVSRSELSSLKPGTIVVWDKCNGHPDGHISIALGDGKEASDCIRDQFINYGPRFRVFEPKASNTLTNMFIGRPMIPVMHAAHSVKTSCLSLVKGSAKTKTANELATNNS